ncbi:MAG: hypothetical protein M3136_04345, partial [Thermoproteota archaeon]|nr:hypothetical protein [Thermoproteota archaeon]
NSHACRRLWELDSRNTEHSIGERNSGKFGISGDNGSVGEEERGRSKKEREKEDHGRLDGITMFDLNSANRFCPKVMRNLEHEEYRKNGKGSRLLSDNC